MLGEAEGQTLVGGQSMDEVTRRLNTAGTARKSIECRGTHLLLHTGEEKTDTVKYSDFLHEILIDTKIFVI